MTPSMLSSLPRHLSKICFFPVTSPWPLGIEVPSVPTSLAGVPRAREEAEVIDPLERGIKELLKELGAKTTDPPTSLTTWSKARAQVSAQPQQVLRSLEE